MIKGIIFDFDGLILDTEVPEFHVWQDIYARNGIDLPLTEWAKCLGSTLAAFDPAKYLQQRAGKNFDYDSLYEEYRRRSLEAILQQPPRIGVEKTLKTAKSRGMKTALASSANIQWVTGHLTRLGLIQYFDCICTQEDVKNVKPDPELFSLALKKLGLQPDEAFVFEDSPNGITAALRAGMRCVAVPNGLTSQLDIHHANLIIEEMDALPFDELLHRLNQNGHQN